VRVASCAPRPVCPEFSVVSGAALGYAGAMLWKKTWEPEAVLALLGGILASFFFGSLAAGLLQHASVAGFRTGESAGSVLLATLSFHGAALALGFAFLRFYETTWREVFGMQGWKHCLALAGIVLLAVAPLMFASKWLSEIVLQKMHWAVGDQAAVEMLLGAGLGTRCYLFFFAVVLAPVAEEFVFRGLLFSLAKHWGRPKLAWLGVSFLFAAFHLNAPVFLPLFLLALALTWLGEVTEGLLAPILAHALFNLANLILLLLAEKYKLLGP
jgi:membrane protease YdiL (CAAX protease family)